LNVTRNAGFVFIHLYTVWFFATNLLICEKAGFGFAEDPFCFHKAITPSHGERLVLQITFTLNKYRPEQTKIIW
jgi:hypothetical protein